MRNTPYALATGLVLCLATAAGCDSDDDGGTQPLDTPTTYAFDSTFTDGSSVSYSGQTMRQVLVNDLKAELGAISGQIDDQSYAPDTEGQVVARLDFFFRFDSDANGEESIRFFSASPAQMTYAEVSTGKDLVGKLAGNDDVTDHKDWDGGDFSGWSDTALTTHGGSLDSPEQFVLALFETLEAQALDRVNGNIPTSPEGTPLPAHVTPEGWDIQQLAQKFIEMGVGYSQGTDDYLDDDVDGKGLLASNAQDGDNAYSALQHAWDEGFGYYGASRDFGTRAKSDVAADAAFDSNGDGAIDFKSEYTFQPALNTAKRDLGANVATDYVAMAFNGFLEGRAIIAAAGDTLTDDELTRLKSARDRVVTAWGATYGMTIVHYINEVLIDMNAIGTDAYSFTDHAKHWSELKGFALGLQFDPRSAMRDHFGHLHGLIGDRPALSSDTTEALAAYRAKLIEARTLLGAQYGFDTANLGDADGENGW